MVAGSKIRMSCSQCRGASLPPRSGVTLPIVIAPSVSTVTTDASQYPASPLRSPCCCSQTASAALAGGVCCWAAAKPSIEQ